MRRQKKKLHLNWKIILIPFALLAIASVIFLLPRFFSITKITCLSQYGECSAYYQDKLNLLKNKSFSDFKNGLAITLKNDKAIKSYTYRLQLPSEVVINILEKKAEYAIRNKDENKVMLIDSQGEVLRVTDGTNLPVLQTDTKPVSEGKISTEELTALELYYDIYTIYQAQYGKIENHDLYTGLPGNLTIIFPLTGDKKVLLGSLSIIYSKMKAEDKNNELSGLCISGCTLDLRFKNPIIK